MKIKFYQLLLVLWRFYDKIINFRKYRKLAAIQKDLQGVLTDRDVDRIILKSRIVRYMRKYLKVDARSKYIPDLHKSREESKQQVIGRFGEEMNILGIYINDELELCVL